MGYLVRGSRGDTVRDIQGMLAVSGLYNHDIDGQYGQHTEAAVKQWQSAVGALPDGHWGPQTMQHTATFLSNFNTHDALAAGNPPVVPPMIGGMAGA